MTDSAPPSAPVPGFVDLHDRLRAGETLFGSFVGLGLAGRDRADRPGRLRLADHRPRARRRHRGRPARPAPRDGRDDDRGTRPAAVRRAAADRAGARPRRARDHGPAGRPPRAGARGDLVHALPAGRASAAWRCRRAAPGSASSATATCRPINAPDPRDHPDRVAERGRARGGDRRDRRGRRPVRRPDGPVAQPRRPGPVRRPALPRRAAIGSTAAAEAAGKAAGILLYDAGRHRRAIASSGSGSSGSARTAAFVASGARAMLAAARGLTLLSGASTPRSAPRHRAAWPARAPRCGRGAVWATTTPTRIRPRPTSWIGARCWSRNTNARTTMKSGSTVLTRAAWAAPIRRAPA